MHKRKFEGYRHLPDETPEQRLLRLIDFASQNVQGDTTGYWQKELNRLKAELRRHTSLGVYG